MKEMLTTILLLICAMALVLLAGMLVVGEGDGRWKQEGILMINKPSWQVVPYFTEDTKRKLWVEGLVQSTPITVGAPRVGSQWRETIEKDHERTEWITELREYEPEKKVTLYMTSDEVDAELRYEFSLGRSTRKTSIRWACDYQFHHWFWKILEPVAAFGVRDKIEGDLDRLKSTLEFGSATP